MTAAAGNCEPRKKAQSQQRASMQRLKKADNLSWGVFVLSLCNKRQDRDHRGFSGLAIRV